MIIKGLLLQKRFIAALAVYTALILLIWFGYHSLSYDSVSRSARENAELTSGNLLNQVSAEFSQMKRTAEVIAGSASVQDFLSAATVEEFYIKAETVSEIIQKTAYPISSADSVITINAAGNFFRFTGALSNNSCVTLYEKFKSAGTLYTIIELDGILYFCHIAPVYLTSSQPIKRAGTVVMLTNLNRIRTALPGGKTLSGIDTAVIQDNIIVLSSNEELEEKPDAELSDIYGMVSRKDISGTNLSVVAAVKNEAIFPDRWLFLAASLILLAILFATVVIFYRYLSGRQKLFDTELLKQNMQINLLISQMDAHFVVNVITSIRTLSMRGDNKKAERMADGLAQLIKHRHSGDALCNLFLELEMTEKYIAVMNIRYDNKFTAEYDVDDSLAAYLIPGLILQPIIENALTHGLQNNGEKEKAMLYIKGYIEGNTIYLIISDNGSGITPVKLKSIRETLDIKEIGNFPEPGLSGVALTNIQRRIRLRFGRSYGVTIDSVLGEGTTVTLTLPAVTDKK